MTTFELYRPREIQFAEIVDENKWKVKVYTISINTVFGSSRTYQTAISHLSDFISDTTQSDIENYQTAFLIIHEAREGVWILFYWWTGGEMLSSSAYFADKVTPEVIVTSPHKVPLVCVWELEVIMHERQAWIEHILYKPNQPDFKAYLNDTLS